MFVSDIILKSNKNIEVEKETKMLFVVILLIICALLCIPSLLSAKTANGEALMYRVTLVQGFIGFAVFVWSFFALLFFLFFQITDVFDEKGIIFLLIILASFIICVATGFLLGFSMILRILSTQGQSESKIKYKTLFQKLIGFQTSTGCLCLIISIWDIFYESAIFPILKI